MVVVGGVMRVREGGKRGEGEGHRLQPMHFASGATGPEEEVAYTINQMERIKKMAGF